MSIEEVERIMDETQDAIEYQRVGGRLHSQSLSLDLFLKLCLSLFSK